ncbi:amidohydrolase [bacterium]|nr:amidohydrolase [bacterium]
MQASRILLAGGHVLSMDSAGSQYPGGFVAIEGERISALGPAAEAPPAQGWELIDCSGCIVMPGLINCHTHLPMVYFRGLADDLPLHEWLTGHIFPAEGAHLSPQFCHEATLLAAAECILGGTTCVNDMYLFADSVASALEIAGLRGLVGEGVIGFPTPSAPTWQDGLKLSQELLRKWQGHPLITPTFCAHAPYTCGVELLQSLYTAAQQHGAPFHIHLHETHAEPGMVQWREGDETPTAALKRIGILGAELIGAHGVWLSERDISLLAHGGCSIAHCPCSNLKLASGIAPVPQLLAAGVPVGLGTDGAASNNNLSMFEELHTAALLPKGAHRDPAGLSATAMPARTAVELATSRAARALKRSDIGQLAPGKLADLIVLDASAAHLAPRYHHEGAVYSHLAYSAQAGDVRDSIVNGRVLMRGRRLLSLDPAALRAQAQAWVDRSYPPAG